jgi:hypothetical protein
VTNVLVWSKWESRFPWDGSDEYVRANHGDMHGVELVLASFIYAGGTTLEAGVER